ncbi:Myb-like domain-containing protein [Phanerochaete sordida]|uniref:Myb-like domain-containing protein n=1 Tax=Phanerochaete sordida TaxID=48140 RepID=A0A9P3LPC0_9APHY|nr:Myb-like domain-containing protein [Phanerochaete sordida]
MPRTPAAAAQVAANARAEWKPAASKALVEALKQAKDSGLMAESGFKPTTWQASCVTVHAATGLTVSVKSSKAHWRTLRSRYKVCKTLRSQSGFGWDDEKSLVIAADAVWKPYIQAHPKAKWFRTHPFPLYNDITHISDDNIATGQFAIAVGGPAPVNPRMDTPAPSSEDESDEMDTVDALAEDETSQITSQNTGPRLPLPIAPTPRMTDDELDWQPAIGSSTSAHPQKRRERPNGASALVSLASSLNAITTIITPPPPSQPLASSSLTATPRCQRAWKTIVQEEGLSSEDPAVVPRIFPAILSSLLSIPAFLLSIWRLARSGL